MYKARVGFVIAMVAPAALSMYVSAAVLDTATVVLTCKNYTVTFTGHDLTEPCPVVQYNWDLFEGGLGFGMAGFSVSDTVTVTPKSDGTFTASVTRPIPRPPDAESFPPRGSATLTTGATVWNTVNMSVTGSFECPVENRCPLFAYQWANRSFPVKNLIVGNPGSVPSPIVYTKPEVRALLSTAPGQDESLVLARQLIAMKLNLFNDGPRTVMDLVFNSPSGDILFVVFADDADFLLGTGRLPQHVDPASDLGKAMAQDAAFLYSYNSGALTPRAADGTCPEPSPF
jgi:hypothetical protein